MAGVAVALVWFLTPHGPAGRRPAPGGRSPSSSTPASSMRSAPRCRGGRRWWRRCGACAMVPFPWVVGRGRSSSSASSPRRRTCCCRIASVRRRWPTPPRRCWRRSTSACRWARSSPSHAVAGREAVLVLMGTVAVSDTAQYYSGRTFGRRPLAPLPQPEEDHRGRGRRIRRRAGRAGRGRVRVAAGHGSAAAGRCWACCSCWPASSATCSSRC